MFAVIIISGSDPEKELSVKFFPSFNEQQVLEALTDRVKEDCSEVEYHQLFEETILLKKSTPLSTYQKINDRLPEQRHLIKTSFPYDQELIFIDPYTSYDYHYYLVQINSDDGIFNLTIFEH